MDCVIIAAVCVALVVGIAWVNGKLNERRHRRRFHCDVPPQHFNCRCLRTPEEP